MSVEQELPDNHPLMLAWQQHKTTDTFINNLRWARVPEHTGGALWSAFAEGWNQRATPAEVAALRAEVERLRGALERIADDITVIEDAANPDNWPENVARAALARAALTQEPSNEG